MKRNVLFLAASLLSSVLFVPSSEARIDRAPVSGRVGNGGFAYVCRDAEAKIISARLLDLWEAEGIPTWSKNDPVDAQIALALEKLKAISNNAWVAVREPLERLRASTISSSRALTPTEDAFPPYQPEKGCGYEQVARYEEVITETGKSGLRIASEIFDSPHFSNSDRAALFFHEAAYFVDRERNDATNSRLTRMVVAHLFSDSPIPNTVRLAAAALMAGKKRWNDPVVADKKVPATIVAVPDPTRIRFETRFDFVDGINSDNLDSMTPVQRSSDYKCRAMVFEQFQPQLHDTGWVTLEKLVKAYVYDTTANAARIEGSFSAMEFSSPETLDSEARNSIYLSCERRDRSGKIRPVKFADAVFKLPEGESLYIMADDSLRTSSGKIPLRPTVTSKSSAERSFGGRKQYNGEAVFQIVRGSF